MGDEPLNVLCVKWGEKYAPEYVDRLRSMVRRHLPLAHRFVCLTDDPRGLAPDVEHRPLPRTDLHGAWNKLLLFASPLHDLAGRALYLDLDVVIVGDLTPLVRYREADPFLGIPDWHRRHTYNSSVLRFTLGAWPQVLQRFLDLRADGTLRPSTDPAEAPTAQRTQVFYDQRSSPPRRFPGDQEWTTSIVRPDGAHRRHAFPSRWIRSWKKHCRDRKRPPRWSRIAVFHGSPKPHEVDAAWVAEHWR